MESLRRDADHGKRLPVQRQRPADDGGILVEAPRPQAMTQHGNWTRPGLVAVAVAEQSPGGRYGSEHGEIVDRHDVAENAVCRPYRDVAAKAHRLRKPRIRVDAVEGGGALTEVEIIRVRAGAEANSAPAAADVHETGRSTTPGGGWKRSAFATVKTVVLAPMPMASDTVAVIVMIGLRRSSRAAWIRSCRASLNHENDRVLNGIGISSR